MFKNFTNSSVGACIRCDDIAADSNADEDTKYFWCHKLADSNIDTCPSNITNPT